MALLCCFGKAERVGFFDALVPSCLGSKKRLQMSAENPAHLQAYEQAGTLQCQTLLAWWESRRASTCLFRWDLSAGASRSLQTSQNRAAVPLPQFSVEDEWAFFLNCWTTHSPPGQAAVAGGTKGRRKSCSASEIPVGVRVWAVGAADLPNPLGFTPRSWAQLGNLAGFDCPVPGKAHLECLVSPTNPQLSDPLQWSEVQRNTQHWEIF